MTVAEMETKKDAKKAADVDVEGLDDGLAVEYNFSDNEDEGVEIASDAEVATSGDGDAEEENDDEADLIKDEVVSVGKKRKGPSDEAKSQKKQKMEFEKESKKALSTEKNDIIVEKISGKVREMFPQLSALELSEYYLNKKNVVDTSDFPAKRTLEHASQFIEMYMKDLIPSIKEYKQLRNKIKKFETKRKFNKKFNKTVEIPKRKFILILSISAIRSCDVHRATRDLEGGSVKLIQKNPIGQDLKMLKTTWSRILNATPGRVDKLLEISKLDHEKNPDNGFSLKEEEIDTVILDNYVDPKLRSVLECAETFELLKKLKSVNEDLKVYLY
jgi:protein CMS1